ncbi:MAG: hypothetical protein KGI51_04310 [Rhodospirillales bacterium]|nr:hypothetical protein [Rhodospirillales bacterium]
MPTVTRFEIADRRPFAGGQSFGETGAYERLTGRVHFAVDPAAPENAWVVDLALAPRGPDGRVHVAADVTILAPADPARSNRRLFFDWGNRGAKRALQFFNDAAGSNDPLAPEHAGNGFLMRRGYTVAWVAWEGDLLPGSGRMTIDLPVARGADAPIAGPVRVEYIVSQPGITCLPLSGRIAARSYPAASLDTRAASLTRRRYPDDAPEPIPPDAWSFARLISGLSGETDAIEQAIEASDTHIHLPSGFAPGWIYELVYQGRDPIVHGLGYVAVRDAVAALKCDRAASPVGPIEKAYGWGRSQTGRTLRDFVWLGANADHAGRRVFDGILPHVAGAGRAWVNQRFSSPIVSGGQQYEDHFAPADRFPFAYAETTDHLTGRRDAILKRPATDPLVIHTQTASEYWSRRGSLAHTDTRGEDLAEPEGVRIFAWSSSQHFADPQARAVVKPGRQNPSNTVVTSMLFRAALDAMDRWATDGTKPPSSRHPRRADGTLISPEAWREQFPAIPGAMRPSGPNTLPLLDFGPEEALGRLAEPPRRVAGAEYAVLVPAVDADGNELGGVRAPMVVAPLATYTGWNPRPRGMGHGALHTYEGSTLPFAETESERAMTGDPRPSVAARYPDEAAYRDAIRRAAEALVADGLMLAEDVERAVAVAAGFARSRHVVAP